MQVTSGGPSRWTKADMASFLFVELKWPKGPTFCNLGNVVKGIFLVTLVVNSVILTIIRERMHPDVEAVDVVVHMVRRSPGCKATAKWLEIWWSVSHSDRQNMDFYMLQYSPTVYVILDSPTVRIWPSHGRDPGSTPGRGITLFCVVQYLVKLLLAILFVHRNSLWAFNCRDSF